MRGLLDWLDFETHYNIITLGFPALFFGLIVAYLYLKGRHKRGL
jgi:hypothetical protein